MLNGLNEPWYLTLTYTPKNHAKVTQEKIFEKLTEIVKNFANEHTLEIDIEVDIPNRFQGILSLVKD